MTLFAERGGMPRSVLFRLLLWCALGRRVFRFAVLFVVLGWMLWLGLFRLLLWCVLGQLVSLMVAEPPERHRRLLEPNHREAQTVSRSLVIGRQSTAI